MAGMRARRRRRRRRRRKQQRRRNYHNRRSLRQGVGAVPRFSILFLDVPPFSVFLSFVTIYSFFYLSSSSSLSRLIFPRSSSFDSLFVRSQRTCRVCEGENNRRENALIEKEDLIPSVQRLPQPGSRDQLNINKPSLFVRRCDYSGNLERAFKRSARHAPCRFTGVYT